MRGDNRPQFSSHLSLGNLVQICLTLETGKCLDILSCNGNISSPGDNALIRGRRAGNTVSLSAPFYSLKTPVVFFQVQRKKKRGNIRENKLLSYCIALVHLPNKMKGLMWHHLQKTRWQTRPTRGCRCPAKRQMIYLAGESRKYLNEELRKGKRQRNPVTGGLGLGICVWVFWRERGRACGHSSS